MSEVGLDEGGILEALSKPIYTRKWTEYVYSKRGANKGKVTEEIEHEVSVSLATLLGITSLPVLYKVLDTMLSRDVIAKVGTGENIEETSHSINRAIGAELDPTGDKFLNQEPGFWLFMPFAWVNTWKYHSDKVDRDAYRERWGLYEGWNP